MSTTGLELIIQERLRQQLKEGWTAEHDDQHTNGEMAQAAACYAVAGLPNVEVIENWGDDQDSIEDAWPWDDAWDKRKKHTRLRQLQIAGALLAAEIDRELRQIGLARPERMPKPLPTIVCLCGSTRFWREFQRASLEETLAGRIVLSIGAASGTDDEHFGNLPREEYDRVKGMLDELHLRKIDLADEVLVLNVGGYVGESTRREVAYAQALGKPIRFLDPEAAKRLVQADGA